MKIIFLICIVLFLHSCSEEKKKEPNSILKKQQWPASTVFTGKNSTFTISLTKELDGLSFKRTDTLKTIYDNALQDVYMMEQDTLSIIISVTQYGKEVIQKRTQDKLFESSMNHFLHSLNAQSTQAMKCTKKMTNHTISGLRTFYSLMDGMTRYFGVSEIFMSQNRVYHIAILSTSKDAITQSPSISLAFHSFMPQ